MRYALIVWIVAAFISTEYSTALAKTAEELKAAKEPLRSGEIKKVRNVSRALLKSRRLGRDQENFNKDKAALKILRRTLRRLQRDLFEFDSSRTVNISTTNVESSPEEQSQKRAQKRKDHLSKAVDKLRGLETDFQGRKIDRKIKKLERKISRLQSKPSAKPKKLAKLQKKIQKLRKRQTKITKKKTLKSEQPPEPTTPTTTDSKDQSKISKFADELEAVLDQPQSVQMAKVQDLLERSGAIKKVKPAKVKKVQPTMRAKTHHGEQFEN